MGSGIYHWRKIIHRIRIIYYWGKVRRCIMIKKKKGGIYNLELRK